MAEAIFFTDPTGAPMPDFWNVTFDVYPTVRAVTTDVMLVQALLFAYFWNPAMPPVGPKAKALPLIFSKYGRRFDDGIYGEKTREVMRLFEEDMKAPYRDGIVRKVSPTQLAAGPETKLMRLNLFWNMAVLSPTVAPTKEVSGRMGLQPLLFREIYGYSP